MTKRAIDFQLIVESQMTTKELHELALETCKKLTRACRGRWVIAVAVIEQDAAETIFEEAAKAAPPRA